MTLRTSLAVAAAFTAAAAPEIGSAGCMDGTVATCFNSLGCSGQRDCVGGRWTPCEIDQSTCPVTGDDFFTASNAPGNAQIGILVDGRNRLSGIEVDDFTLVLAGAAPATVFDVGDLKSSTLGNEVISFATGRAPDRVSTPWTLAADQMGAAMTGTLRVPITLWIVTAPNTFGVQAVQALSTAIHAGALFDQERLGLDWNAIEVRDATTNPNAATFSNVAGNFAQLRTLIGHVGGRINVYWVPAVNGCSGCGLGLVWNGDMVAVGQNADGGLLAHEVGHCLALDHVDGDGRFDGTNVMHSNGGTRQFLTEGQALRAHIRDGSAIRSAQVYALRAGMPIRNACDINMTSRDCPKADKRIWADGATWPPN